MEESLNNSQLAIAVEDVDVNEEVICDIKNKSETLATIKEDFEKSSHPVFGHVAVTNSENVHFGNNTYFNGPVVIKQIVQNSSTTGVDNASYINTEDTSPQSKLEEKSLKLDKTLDKYQCKTWYVLIIIIGVIAIIGITCSIYFSSNQEENREIQYDRDELGQNLSSSQPFIAPFHLRFVQRTDWLAQPPTDKLDVIKHPIPWVVITHTATESCSIQSECVLQTRLIQNFHIESRQWYDIGYNFLVGGDGSVYVGRGWDFVGAHTKGYNIYSIAVAFIGTFTTEAPPKRQFEACQRLLMTGVKLGKLSKDYKLLAHRQLMSTTSPGDKVYDVIKEWPHFVKDYKDIEGQFNR